MTKENLEKLAADPKAFLMAPTIAENRVKLAEAEIQRYHDIAVGITQTIKPVVTFTGGPGRKVEQCAVEIIALEEELSQELSTLYQSTILVKEAVSFLEEPGLYNIIWARYICRLSNFKAAEALGWSERWAAKQHSKALKALRQAAQNKLSQAV